MTKYEVHYEIVRLWWKIRNRTATPAEIKACKVLNEYWHELEFGK